MKQQTNFQEEKTKETFNAARVSSKLKKLRISFISVLFWNGSNWFCPFTLEPNGTVPNGNIPSAEPKSPIAVSNGKVPRVLV